MNHKKSFEINEILLNKIIYVAYGDAKLWDVVFIKQLAVKHPEVKSSLESYKKTAIEIHKLSEENCPEELLIAVEEKTTGINKRRNMFATDLMTIIFTRPLVSATVVTLLIGFIVFGILENRDVQYKFSKEEIEIADMQTKQALAIVGEIFEETNTTLKEEVLNSRVAKPIRESMGIVNGLFMSTNTLNKGEIE